MSALAILISFGCKTFEQVTELLGFEVRRQARLVNWIVCCVLQLRRSCTSFVAISAIADCSQQGRHYVDQALPRILEDGELRLSGPLRVLLAQLRLELEQITSRIEEMDRVIQKTAKENEDGQRLSEIPGVGPVTATALIASVGNASTFQKGRNLAAWMGIVPGEYSTAGKQKLLGISKRDNKYLRTPVCSRCTQRCAAATQASSRSEPLVSATVGAHAPECGHRGLSQ